jgi:carboxymethylenebutenolidase
VTEVGIALDGGRRMRAEFLLPEGGSTEAARAPGVVVLHELYGLEPDIVEAARRFTARGYAAIVPDLLSAGPRIACLARAMVEARSFRPGRTSAAVDAARQWLAARDEVDASRIGIIGFCLGGGFALAYGATSGGAVQAVSINYGDVPRERERLRGVCPVVGSFGGRDRVFRSRARPLAEHLEALGVDHDVKVYDAAGHSFMTDGHHPVASKIVAIPMRPGYVGEAAEDAWTRVFAFFDRHVVGAHTV